ncbi:MAG: hypothetical protein COT74_12095 [Bdellovibrionales bacterium CG10_big_fil_rev_8_21_14_0_10_45_34]|nr:MAG: hypothetical protein COT74_12095 [Bdellovibrionales bacterium CG10_big_fil_rev_8_21_14_0_10_45_34]
MDRRSFIEKATLGGATVVAANVLGASKAKAHQTEKHHHHDIEYTKAEKEILETTADCIETGKACRAHCISELREGHVDLKDCLSADENMLAVVTAVNEIVRNKTAGAAHVKALVQVCRDLCVACAEACKPHAKMHKSCKACLKACEECVKACDKYLKA